MSPIYWNVSSKQSRSYVGMRTSDTYIPICIVGKSVFLLFSIYFWFIQFGKKFWADHQLLSAKSFSEEDLKKRQLVLETVQQKVTHVMASPLLQPFIDTEVWTAAKSLGKYVCLGKDAIGVVFYLHYWDLLGPILTRPVNLIFSTGKESYTWFRNQMLNVMKYKNGVQ